MTSPYGRYFDFSTRNLGKSEKYDPSFRAFKSLGLNVKWVLYSHFNALTSSSNCFYFFSDYYPISTSPESVVVE